MGDRANIKMKTGADEVHLYTHWAGSELPAILKSALERGRSRWNDSQYLARIIFCEMVKGCEMEEMGFGISAGCGDGGDRVITVDVGTGIITISKKEFCFEDYIEQDSPSWFSPTDEA